MFPVPASVACLTTQACSDCILTLDSWHVHTKLAFALASGMPHCGCTWTAWTPSWHMQPTMAATEAESAPPERGTRKPPAPDRRMKSHSQQAGPAGTGFRVEGLGFSASSAHTRKSRRQHDQCYAACA